ncbi:MAG TPA: ABC transporter substrate-binding protein [Pseudobacteroides sp.]|uniref:ABC transporter substrate-binding protein n=1 Tax=Pseudobacteroides sp. TaxID=1968840 RepID=UPI002F93A699
MRNTKKAIIFFILIMLFFNIKGSSSSIDFNRDAMMAESNKNGKSLPPYKIIWYHAHKTQKDMQLVLKKVNEYLIKRINATLEMRLIPEADYDNRLKSAISSGEKFDICFTSVWMNSYTHNALRGSFIELDPLLEKYGKGTLNALPQILLNGARVKDKLYTLPANQDLAHQWGISLNKKYTDKYGVDVSNIKKIEDLEPMLKIIKEKEKDVVPYLIYPYSCHAFSMPMERVEEQVPSGLYLDNRTGYKVVNAMEITEFKNYLSLMHKWYKAGYILKDAASLKNVSNFENAGNWFAGSVSYNPLLKSKLKEKLGYDVTVVPIGSPFITKKDTVFFMHAISSTSQDPGRTVMFLELLNTDKYLFNLIAYGIEGIHYQKTGENAIKLLDNSYHIEPCTFGNMKLSYTLSSYSKNISKDIENFNASPIISPLLEFNFDPEPVKNEIEKITEVTEEFEGPLFVGAVDPEIYLPKIIQKYKAAGLDKVMAQQQNQLDTWLLEKRIKK